MSSKKSRSKAENVVSQEKLEEEVPTVVEEVVEERKPSETELERRDSLGEEEILPHVMSQSGFEHERWPSSEVEPLVSMHSEEFSVDLEENPVAVTQPLATINEAPETESEGNN